MDTKLHELSDDSVAELYELLRSIGVFERNDAGDVVPVSAAATAAHKLREGVQSREPVDFDDEEFVSAQLAIEYRANEVRGGFDSLNPT